MSHVGPNVRGVVVFVPLLLWITALFLIASSLGREGRSRFSTEDLSVYFSIMAGISLLGYVIWAGVALLG
jgi:hypothetical protein